MMIQAIKRMQQAFSLDPKLPHGCSWRTTKSNLDAIFHLMRPEDYPVIILTASINKI
jgi:hypothetical protein